MKSKNLILSAMLMALPSTLMAQQNIQKAFDALLKDKIVETKTQHTLERDPETGQKTAQADVYDFTLPTLYARKHIKEIQEAFEKDKDAAYTYRTGTHRQDEVNERVDKKRHETMLSVIHYSRIQIAVGDGKQSVAIGTKEGANYVYACFNDEDDATKKYRYCYAMDWVEQNGETIVRLAVTYATTLQYRNNKRQTRTFIVNGEKVRVDGNSFSNSFSLGNGFPFDNSSVFDSDSISFNRERSSEGWLSEFNTYKRLYQRNPDGSAANYYATYIYKLCKKADCLENEEKQLVATEIKRLKAKTKDEFIQQLFDMGIERLKK